MINRDKFTIVCTGDACTGDTILFTEEVWGGSWKHPTLIGERTLAAEILKDSYGAVKQTHTFTLKVIECEGTDAIAAGTVLRRKGHTVYKNGTRRLEWTDESQRKINLDEKHARGDAARKIKRARIERADEF